MRSEESKNGIKYEVSYLFWPCSEWIFVFTLTIVDSTSLIINPLVVVVTFHITLIITLAKGQERARTEYTKLVWAWAKMLELDGLGSEAKLKSELGLAWAQTSLEFPRWAWLDLKRNGYLWAELGLSLGEGKILSLNPIRPIWITFYYLLNSLKNLQQIYHFCPTLNKAEEAC